MNEHALTSVMRIRLVRYREAWLLKGKCPHCKRTHTHGGGDGNQPFDHGYLGHRIAHCSSARDYYLTLEENQHDHTG